MVSEKRFVVETVEITDCDTDVSRIAKVITDTDETYSYEDLYEVAELLNEQQEHITHLEDTNDNFRIKLIEDIEAMEQAEKKIGEQQTTINKVYELLEEADIFSDEATEHDIKAYIELQEFDNKDAYYLACDIKKAIKLLKGDVE